jgi:hypothetical protein
VAFIDLDEATKIGSIIFDPIQGGEHVAVNVAGLFVAVGGWAGGAQFPNSTAHSANGVDWVGNGLLPGASISGGLSNGVAYSEFLRVWVVVSDSPAAQIAWSIDGISWPSINTTSFFTQALGVTAYQVSPSSCF